MTDLTRDPNFVTPHYIEELGEEGLTLHEVAASLGIQFGHAKEALEKNINEYSMVGISSYVNKGPIRGMVEVQSYALNTIDAKCFVARYQNDIGRGYLRYLLQCERIVHKMQAPELDLADKYRAAGKLLKTAIEINDIFGAPRHLIEIEAVKEVHAKTDVDFTYALRISPAQNNIQLEDMMLEPTELARRLGLKNAREANKKLEKLGLQVRRNGEWHPTEKGTAISLAHAWKKGTKTGYNLKWRVSAIRQRIEAIEAPEA